MYRRFQTIEYIAMCNMASLFSTRIGILHIADLLCFFHQRKADALINKKRRLSFGNEIFVILNMLSFSVTILYFLVID